MLFENIKNRQLIALMLFHVFLGLIFNLSSLLLDLWYGGVLMAGIFNIINKQNRNEAAGLTAAYFVGLEVVSRMCGADVPWEAGKYILVVVLLLGRANEKAKSSIPNNVILYILMLVPSLLLCNFPDLTLARMHLSFNLSGPISLFVAAAYFYRRTYTVSQLRILFLAVILPVISMCVCIVIKAPTLSELSFADAANFQLSGNYGPNQVASILGFAICLLMCGFFLNFVITTSALFDRILTIVFFVFCVINFSRGGILTAIISTIFSSIIWSRYSTSDKKNVFFLTLSLIIVLMAGAFIYFDSVTGNALSKRYLGTLSRKDPKYEEFGSGFSGREDIAAIEWEMFKSNPILGVGPGMGYFIRAAEYDKIAAAHTEFTRLLSEHGILGIIAFLVLITAPIGQFNSSTEFYRRLFLVMFVSYSLICSLHAAMRIAMMGFSYGFAFINLQPNKRNEFDPVVDYQQKSMMWQQYESEGVFAE